MPESATNFANMDKTNRFLRKQLDTIKMSKASLPASPSSSNMNELDLPYIFPGFDQRSKSVAAHNANSKYI